MNAMFTGSEVPLNQSDSLPGLRIDSAFPEFSFVGVGSNSAASSGETGSGEIDRSLPILRNGKKVDDREGEVDRLKGRMEAKSLEVFEQKCVFQGRATGRGGVICKSSVELQSAG
jgi:hypothetical protein